MTAARISLAIVIGLLAWNLVALVSNRRHFSTARQPHVSPPSIIDVALASDNPEVSAGMAAYYLIGLHLAGRTLVIPAREHDHRFWLEHVSRLQVEEVAEPIAASPPRGEVTRSFLLYLPGGNRRERALRSVDLIVEPGARRYELGDRADGTLLIQPAGTSLMPK